MQKVAQTIIMSEGTALFLKALGGILTGILVASGHLDANNQNTFSQSVDTIAGAIVTILSSFYLLEHAFQSAKEELKWSYTPESKTDSSALPAKPEVVDPPAQPAA